MPTPDTAHLDYGALLRESKRLDARACARTQRIAILSDAAVPQLEPLLKVLFARHGVRAEIYLAPFDSAEIQVLDPASALYAFAPDVIALLPSVNALRLRYHRETDDREHFADRVVASMAAIWDAIRGRSATLVLQGNIVPPYERQFGNYDQLVPETLAAQVARLNVAIGEHARRRHNVLVNDIAGLAVRIGLERWFDERLWALAKTFCALDHLPLVAQNIVDVVLCTLGRVVKCVVVDLDNTLWGGVIGDDGIEGIELDPFGRGEPYHRLQHYLRELKRRGIVLAVCSKNDPAIAIQPFRDHPDMVLRENDIAMFVVDWGPKPHGIQRIEQALNIGLDAIVFLDDEPFERRLVRETLPELIVPELPEDPADYVRALAALNLFEATAFSDEDRRRSDAYRTDVARTAARPVVGDIGGYLASLDMRAALRPFDAFALPRVAQLIQRSNQFNVTTRRHSLPACEAMMNGAGDWLPFYVTLADKFGDLGIVSVIILQQRADTLDVDSWLMSCRVLGRTVEQFAMNRVVEIARDLGCASIVGTYVPSAKNAMVKGFFAQFGFEAVETRDDGGGTWRLRVSSYRPGETYVMVAP